MFHSATTFFKNLDLGQGFKKKQPAPRLCQALCATAVPGLLCQVLCATARPGPLCHDCAVASFFPFFFLSIFLVMAIFVI